MSGRIKRKLTWLQRRLDSSTPSGLEFTLSLAVAGMMLAFFGAILLGIHETSTTAAFDRFVAACLVSIRSGINTIFFETFTGMAGVYGSLTLIALYMLLSYPARYRRLAYILAVSAAISAGIVVIIKFLVARPRPSQALQLVHETSFSFPSGHTMGAVVIYGVLTYFIARTFESRRAKVICFAIWGVFVGLVASSRIYLGVHFPSDTLASASLGAAGLCLGLAWLTRNERALAPASFDRQARWRMFAALAGTALLVMLLRPFFI